MAEDAKKAVNKGIDYAPACRPFNNEVDVIYNFRVRPGTPEKEGVGQEIIIPGFDTSKGFDGFEAWCKDNYECTAQVYLARAQKNIGTIAQYDKTFTQEANQKLADDVTLVKRAGGGVAKVNKAKAAQMDELTALLGEDKLKAMIEKAKAKTSK